jgi:hypothetical protein
MSRPLQPSLFLERLIRFLLPFFLDATQNVEAARSEILETIASHGAHTRAQMLNVAQIIAFGLSALELLSEARATTEMSPSMRLRFRSCANGLNRACQQNANSLAKHLACDHPEATAQKAEPINDIPDEIVQEAIERSRAKIESYRNRLYGTKTPDQRPWGSKMMESLVEQVGKPTQHPTA